MSEIIQAAIPLAIAIGPAVRTMRAGGIRRMSMEPTIARLRAMDDEDLIAEHDRVAGSTQIGTEFYLNELARRSIERRTATMVRLTWVITWLTGIVTVLTALNLVAVFRTG